MRKKLHYLALILAIPCIALCISNRSHIKRFIYNRNLHLVHSKVDPTHFKQVMDDTPPPWMSKQIHQDLQSYVTRHISRRELDETYRTLQDRKIARFQINRSRLTYQTTCNKDIRFKSVKDGLKAICKVYPHLQADFVVCLEDKLDDYPDLPVFVFAKDRHNQNQILMPDFTCFAKKTTSYAWTYSLMPRIEKANDTTPWVDKIERCIWRGAATGINFDRRDFISAHRCKACILSEFYPEFLDARFTDGLQVPKERRNQFFSQFHLSTFITPESQIAYKYLLCLDGNSCTYPGLHWRLLSNSVVLKPETDSIQWFYEGLIPNYHYILVEKDLANLIPKLQWAQRHDNQARAIADHATEFAHDNLSQEAIFRYFCLLLEGYRDVCSERAIAFESGVHKKRARLTY